MTQDQIVFHDGDFTELHVRKCDHQSMYPVMSVQKVRLTQRQCEVDTHAAAHKSGQPYNTDLHGYRQGGGFQMLCACVCVLLLSGMYPPTLSNRLASMCLRSCCLQSAGILEAMSSGF